MPRGVPALWGAVTEPNRLSRDRLKAETLPVMRALDVFPE